MKAIWSGTLSFGLVNIPISLYSPTREERLNFVYLREGDLCPVGYERVCKNTGEIVPFENIVRGYKYNDEEYVVMTDQDFENANVEKTNNVEIIEFTNENEIDPVLYKKPYYLEPGEGADKMYVLLREALNRSSKVGVCRFVLRKREHLGVLKPRDEFIILDEIRYASEIRGIEQLKSPEKEKIDTDEMNLALKIIDEMSTNFRHDEYKDTYTEELLQTIKQKAQNKKFKIEPKGEPPRPTQLEDLSDRLKESLDKAQRGQFVSV